MVNGGERGGGGTIACRRKIEGVHVLAYIGIFIERERERERERESKTL